MELNRKSRTANLLKNQKGEWWPGTESNCRHEDFQSSALPTELPGQDLEILLKFLPESRFFKLKEIFFSYFFRDFSPHFSPGHEARARRCPKIQGARETKCAGVLYSTSSPLSERNAVDSGRCTPTAVGW